ncbi:peptidase m66 protein [Purpureocillium lilacinum]|uniref:Peptidase m66 protein n=1 Tax=Purpureocillium lilacinum TaxID=33203 RepID=A0A179FJ86_PURLI|nr:peptidase m66 protein [Purpureocillium lilacinum]OAQ65602.1 peptidase m66 protein [Purpureocillium lilacinum]
MGKSAASEISQKNTLPADYRAFIRTSINNGWKKLDEYYSKLGESPLFAAAIILHPRFGLGWLEATWVAEEQLAWVRDAKAGIKDYFSRWYSRERERREETGLDNSARRTMGQEDDQYTQWINSKTKKALEMGGNNGELDRYLRLEPQDTQDPIQWWREHTSSFPSLSSFALDVFAIPAMASDCERQFSLAKLTLTSQRLSMSADTLERVQCLKNWVRHGGVKLALVEAELSNESTLRFAWCLETDDAFDVWAQYSADRGKTWRGLTIGLCDGSAEVDIAGLPAGQVLLRLLTHDGFSTVASDTVKIKVPERAPYPAILYPAHGELVPANAEFEVLGSAVSQGGDPVDDDCLEWFVDGKSFGRGRAPTLQVKPGDHKLTLRANAQRDAEVTIGFTARAIAR